MRYLVQGAIAAALLVLATSASAQTSPVGASAPPMMVETTDWTGFYLGVNVGGGAASSKYGFSTPGSFSPTNAIVFIPPVFTPGPTFNGSFNLGGPLGGGTAGYNWELSNGWLLGLEGDIDASGISGSSSCGAGAFASICGTSNSWLGTARARVGYAPGIGNMLWFVTGGAAFGDVNRTVNGPIAFSSSSDKVGWTVGAGGEYMFAPRWSAKVEYRYVDLASDFTANIGLLGINYHFAAPPPPPPAPAAAPAPPPVAPKVFIVFFDWDKDVITPEGEQIIQQAAEAYKSGAPVQLQVTGYTDRSGSPGYNQRLSERRANNVARALAALGVPKNEMVVSGRGENDNRVPTAPGVREPQNRRVEIVAP